MQSMFRLPWSTDAPGDKIMEKATIHKTRPLHVVDMPSFMKLKRKRTDSPEPAPPSHVVKKWKSANAVAPATAIPELARIDSVASDESSSSVVSQAPADASSESLPKAHPVKMEGASESKVPTQQTSSAATSNGSANQSTTAMETDSPTDLTAVQQTIEAQFNYEILLKHQELRLIEQELAKCQVSLEQLRRCSLIPFPGTDGPSLDVSGGVGYALPPAPGHTKPKYAAPWGVTDGPYTRHYAKWLIQDPKFDSIPERELAQQQSSQAFYGSGAGRATRGSFAEFGSTGKARTSRTSTGTLKLPALGENPAPAPKIDPLLHKRSTDGQWVRLYCAQCGHSNFSNTQGFLNHCRIKHNQVFKSHDQAAIACGVPVDVNEGGQPVPVPATEPASTTVSTPVAAFPPPQTPGVVHPLIKANPPQMAANVHRDFSRKPTKITPPVPESKLHSPSTPYMTALLQKRGFEGDLKQMVDTARTKVDLDSMETSDDDSAAQTPVTAQSQQLARLPVSAPNAAPASKAAANRPGSKKGHGSQARFPHVPPPVNVGHHHHHNHSPASPVDLSPHTVESNPGLVSDHDDDDSDDADDAKSQIDVMMNDDVVVEDASDAEGVAAERTGSRKGLEGCFQKGEGSRKH
ncbi:hypothetical protein BU24DRAFT_350540 [Aaosphaeria arxii CBS 175.79]|uniref:AHC1-like C2H2 zinc-finger domain-containing protein n=1 Tax=Aaosphaeria arxii CBS 175.79 TaxID=1450172 RepID=A0A6A5XM97_9PLEO|nr:uncharacterized protein BU24DRAFT_350540 [Aaosphaeria arxii CBS 175.79]KAF2013967.1 hypothetical protein BU24DRAFT_350540 [Aaosphaeria arxii CBS 175.79]